MSYFFDSSALVKLYHPEIGSPKVEALFREPDRRIIISRLVGVELHSAFFIKVRTGQVSADESASLRTRFLEDVATGAIAVIAVSELHYATAETFIVRHGNRKGLRTLDAIQLAVAQDVQHRAGLDALIVADRTLAEIAREEGVPVINPEDS